MLVLQNFENIFVLIYRIRRDPFFVTVLLNSMNSNENVGGTRCVGQKVS